MAKKKYDLERFTNDIESMLKAKLNNKIDEINTEKGDDIIINHINDKAYIFQTLDDKIISFNETIFYYIDDFPTQAIDSAGADNVTVDVIVILSDAKDSKRAKKLLRYQRALKELFNKEFNGIQSSIKIRVESLTPISFALQNTSSYVDAIGVRISTTIVN